MEKEKWGKLALTSALGVFLSSSFVFLAALPIRYLRLQFGRWPFFATALCCSVGLLALQQWQWALVYLSLSFLVGSYCELEEQKFSIFLSGGVSIFLTSCLSVFSFGLIARFQGMTLFSYFQSQFAPLTEQLEQLPQFKGQVDMQTLVQYLPSGIMISLMLVLFVSLLIFTDTKSSTAQQNLKAFNLPEILIWPFILSLAGTFLLEKGSMESLISVNVLSVVLAAYFFQGLAVFASFLDYMRVFGFWRLLAYFLIFFQMFIFISLLGVLDFWFDFRPRMTKWTETQKKKV